MNRTCLSSSCHLDTSFHQRTISGGGGSRTPVRLTSAKGCYVRIWSSCRLGSSTSRCNRFLALRFLVSHSRAGGTDQPALMTPAGEPQARSHPEGVLAHYRLGSGGEGGQSVRRYQFRVETSRSPRDTHPFASCQTSKPCHPQLSTNNEGSALESLRARVSPGTGAWSKRPVARVLLQPSPPPR